MDNAEFSQKVISQKQRMYRLAKSLLCDIAEAEDAVQDVMERLWTRRSDLASYGNLNAFILTSVKNACLDRIRSRKLREDKKVHVANRFESVTDPRSMQDLRDMKALAEQVIALLPEKQRLVIHLRDVEGFDMDEISGIMDMEEDILRVYLSRARKAVREKLLTMMNYGVRH